MEPNPSMSGITELSKNARFLLVLTTVAFSLEGLVLVGEFRASRSTALLHISLVSLVVALYAGTTVLLKSPFGVERSAGLDSTVHRGINLFYGLQLGAFMIAMATAAYWLIFG